MHGTNSPPRQASPMLLAGTADIELAEPFLPETPLAAYPSSLSTLSPSLTARLYISHFFSTWNSRLFEFGAVLFLADIFPSSLLPLSTYALVRAAAVILGAQAVGELVDEAGRTGATNGRLGIVRTSILGGRGAVVGSCMVFLLLQTLKSGRGDSDDSWKGTLSGRAVILVLFVGLIALACVEKLCGTMNLVAIERDWVVVMTEGNETLRQSLNARMRRIDLLCKVVGPLAISSIAVASTSVAIWATLGINLLAVLPEYICIAQVYERVPALQSGSATVRLEDQEDAEGNTKDPPGWIKKAAYRILPLKSAPYYVHHPAFLPSFSLALLYLTVLSLSGQMLTYLISVGYTPLYIGIIRTVSTIFELSATWIAPPLMKRIGVVRCGMWGLSWQMIWITAGVGWYCADAWSHGTNSFTSATGLVVGVTLSRTGLWSYDLCAQSIIQDEVNGDHRGSFSTVEAALQNLFELASYVTTIVFSRPEQFQWPVIISITAMYIAGGMYAGFVRKRRGHLFHRPSCICSDKGAP